MTLRGVFVAGTDTGGRIPDEKWAQTFAINVTGLYLVADEREMIDLTPTAGSIYRSVAIQTRGSIYNQRGEKVNEVVFRVTESIKLYKDPNDAPKNPGFFACITASNPTGPRFGSAPPASGPTSPQ